MRTAVIGRFFNISRNLWREPETELKLYYVPNGGEFPDGKIQEYGELREYSCDFKNDGSFEFAVTAESEGEYSFCISIVKDGVTMLDLANFSCYALDSDLYALRPYNGDTHVHTCFSRCGSINEEPPYVTAFGRKRCLDFMFITDHLQCDPSVTADSALENFGSDYRVYPGEEYHVPKIGWRFFIRLSIHIQRFISLHWEHRRAL